MFKKLDKNLEKKVIQDFGNEWNNFDQSAIRNIDLKKAFNQYFKIFPKSYLNKKGRLFDVPKIMSLFRKDAVFPSRASTLSPFPRELCC